MTEEKTTIIGEASGLVPVAKLEEVEAELARATKANERLAQDVETRDQTIVKLESEHAGLVKKVKRAVEDKTYAEREAVKVKGDEARHKREIERLTKANEDLSQEVDQLRAKGSEMWGTVVEVKRVRDEYAEKFAAISEDYDAAMTELGLWKETFGPVVEFYVKTISEFIDGVGKLLAQPGVQVEIKRLLDEAEKAQTPTEETPNAV